MSGMAISDTETSFEKNATDFIEPFFNRSKSDSLENLDKETENMDAFKQTLRPNLKAFLRKKRVKTMKALLQIISAYEDGLKYEEHGGKNFAGRFKCVLMCFSTFVLVLSMLGTIIYLIKGHGTVIHRMSSNKVFGDNAGAGQCGAERGSNICILYLF